MPRRLETVIELTHRVTSAGALILVLAFAAITVVSAPPRHRLRRAAYLTVALMVVEALIGAALVIWRLVAGDTSGARAVVMPAHLMSTYALVAVLTLATRWGQSNTVSARDTRPAPERPWLLLGAVAILLVAATGAVTALGDTLFPPAAASLAGRLQEDQGAAAHFLQRLRVLHPVLAVFTAAFVMHLASPYVGDGRAALRGPSRGVLAFAIVQLLAGCLNVLLSAPGWLQVVHLGLALGLWIAFVSLAAELAETRRDAALPA